MLEELQAINYGQKWVDSNSSFVIERPFTWIDWKKAKLIKQVEQESFEGLNTDEQNRLLFSVFPLGNSLMRMLAQPIFEDGPVSKEDSSSEAEAMFRAASESFNIEVPLFTDCYGLQPLDYAFGLCAQVKMKNYREVFLPLSDDEQKQIEKSENLKLAQIIFKYT